MRAFLVVASLAAFAAHGDGLDRYVDLDRPGALEALNASNPGHYRGVMQAVSSQKVACESRWSMLKIAKDTGPCSASLLLTSFPPKSHLTVPLDGTLYAITVRFDTRAYRLTPAR